MTSLSDLTRQIPKSHISMTVKLHIAYTSQFPQIRNNHVCIRVVLISALPMPLRGTTVAHEAPWGPTDTPWPHHTSGIYSVCKPHRSQELQGVHPSLYFFSTPSLLLSNIFLGTLLPCYVFASSSKLCTFSLVIKIPLNVETSPNPFYLPRGQMLKARKVFINWQDERGKQSLPLWSALSDREGERLSSNTTGISFPPPPKVLSHHKQGQL